MNHLRGTVLPAVAAVCCLLPAGSLAQRADARLVLNVRNVAWRYASGAVFVLPDEQLLLSVNAPADRLHALDAPQGRLLASGPNHWSWRAPRDAGTYSIEVRDPDRKKQFDFSAVVMIPSSRVVGGQLNNYRIGEYPSRPLNGNAIYRPPAGFIEVDRDNEDLHVSPHFRLKQFLSKQESGYPKYLVLDERLIFVLEAIGDSLETIGYDAGDIEVMSGFRTPFYNHAIGNVMYSLHLWGRAADIFLDKDGNGRMDDLNRDRVVDRRDAVELAGRIEELSKTKALSSLVGGIGIYEATATHGPFVHVDTRPSRARW